MNRKQKLEKIYTICDRKATKCEMIIGAYEDNENPPTPDETKEAESADKILEILVQIMDLIE